MTKLLPKIENATRVDGARFTDEFCPPVATPGDAGAPAETASRTFSIKLCR